MMLHCGIYIQLLVVMMVIGFVNNPLVRFPKPTA